MKDFFYKNKKTLPAKCLPIMILLTFTLGCRSLFAAGPYSLQGISNMNRDRFGYGFTLRNNSPKKIQKAEFVLSFYNSDGEPVFETDWINVQLELEVEPESEAEGTIPLEEYRDLFPEDFATDYFYVSKLWYEDGSIWEDPFGRFADW